MVNIKQSCLISDEIMDLSIVKKQRKAVFKPYCQDQVMLLPKSVNELIPDGHICYLLSEIIGQMDIPFLTEKYLGGGASAYDPKMMLKVWILGFVDKVYTSRPLARNLRQDITYIWISGNQTPDFHTLNNFRLRLKSEIKAVFKQIVAFGMNAGIIKGDDIFIDHTKKEANANKHKMVWKKQVERQLGKIDSDIDELFDHIDKLNEEEDRVFGGKDLPEMERKGFDKGKIKEIADKLNEKIRKKELVSNSTKEMRKDFKQIIKLQERKENYLMKKARLGSRNSYSRTDPDAVAMMMKDKLSIKPGYNEGIAVENGFVVNYELSNNCADNMSFIPLMKGAIGNLSKPPKTATADSAYGTEDDYLFLEQNCIGNFLKYNLFHKEKSRKWREEKLRFDDFTYNEEDNSFICRGGAKLSFVEYKKDITKSGYIRELSIYKVSEGKCNLCPYKDKCTTSKARTLQVSWELERFKAQARQNLNSAKGIELRFRRGNEVESVFGDSKLNKNHRRYILRGIEKINIEVGLHYMAYNIRKIKDYLMKKIDGDKSALPHNYSLIFSLYVGTY